MRHLLKIGSWQPVPQLGKKPRYFAEVWSFGYKTTSYSLKTNLVLDVNANVKFCIRQFINLIYVTGGSYITYSYNTCITFWLI